MWKSRAFLKCQLLQELCFPKLEARILVFAHPPYKSTRPVSVVLHPGMLMEFVYATCWTKEQKQAKNNSESSHSRQHLSHWTSCTATLCSPLTHVAFEFLAHSGTVIHKKPKRQLLPIALGLAQSVMTHQLQS